LREYLAVLKKGGNEGVAQKLAIRLWHLRHDTAVCSPVDVNISEPPSLTYNDVPAKLRDFDVDDHKWIAVAVTKTPRPPIYQAKDSEWWERRSDFAECGLDVQFLCAGDLIQAQGG
jgi:hypothetical protein